jgi:hypothetical protein
MGSISDVGGENLSVNRLVRAIRDSLWRTEPLHERDCWACDVAADLAGTWAASWDVDQQWYKTPVDDGVPGDTMLDQATRIAAYVLHRRIPRR